MSRSSGISLPVAATVLFAGLCAFAPASAAKAGKHPTSAKPQPRFKAIWEPVNVKQDLELRSVHFISPEEGWVAGGTTEVSGGVIYHTADGGATWELQAGDPQSSDRSIAHLRFRGGAHGWAVQATSGGDHRLLGLNGAEWNEVGTVAQHRGDYTFTSAGVGFETSHDGILQTRDGGRHWQPVYPCKMTVDVNGLTRNVDCEFAKLFFLDDKTGWAISNAGPSGSGFAIARTHDGGESWVSSVVLPGEDPREGSIFFTDESHGALLSRGKFFVTDDGGTTWKGASGQVDGKPEIQFANAKIGWAIHYTTMTYTVDGGHHWISREISFPASVEAFSLVSPDSGYVVGDHGMVYRYRIVPIEYKAKGILSAPAMVAK